MYTTQQAGDRLGKNRSPADFSAFGCLGSLVGDSPCRQDLMVLPQIINALPEETEISSFVYHGRDLTIRTVQQDAESVYEMVDRLEQWVTHEEKVFEKVVYSYYLDADGRCIAEITLISYQYQDYDLREELENRILPDRQEQD